MNLYERKINRVIKVKKEKNAASTEVLAEMLDFSESQINLIQMFWFNH